MARLVNAADRVGVFLRYTAQDEEGASRVVIIEQIQETVGQFGKVRARGAQRCRIDSCIIHMEPLFQIYGQEIRQGLG